MLICFGYVLLQTTSVILKRFIRYFKSLWTLGEIFSMPHLQDLAFYSLVQKIPSKYWSYYRLLINSIRIPVRIAKCGGPSDKISKTEALCHISCGTIKIPPWSKAISADQRPTLCSSLPIMVMSPYEYFLRLINSVPPTESLLSVPSDKKYTLHPHSIT